jgi:hypothetical protein
LFSLTLPPNLPNKQFLAATLDELKDDFHSK